MNYQKIYDSIIVNAKSLSRNKKTGFYEKHHIIPKCLGGSNEETNLVLLTPREHFICHFLLWRITPIRKLRDPILFFTKDGVNNSRLYDVARKAHIHEMKINNPSLHLSDAAKAAKNKKLSDYAKNRPAAHNTAISKIKKGTKPRLGAILSDESKSKIGESLKEYFKNNEISQETREKLRATSTGRLHTKEALEKMSLSAKNRVKYQCPFCKDMPPSDGGGLALHMKAAHKWTKEQIFEERQNWIFDEPRTKTFT